MNKAELTELVQKALGAETTKRAAADALEAVLSSIAKGIKKDGSVQLIGFGTFKVAKRAVFVADKAGNIVHVEAKRDPSQLPSFGKVRKAIGA